MKVLTGSIMTRSVIKHEANVSLKTTIGLERTDNNMELSSWPQIPPINQKNYYTYVVGSMA